MMELKELQLEIDSLIFQAEELTTNDVAIISLASSISLKLEILDAVCKAEHLEQDDDATPGLHNFKMLVDEQEMCFTVLLAEPLSAPDMEFCNSERVAQVAEDSSDEDDDKKERLMGVIKEKVGCETKGKEWDEKKDSVMQEDTE